jgi:hypothetical protein
MGMVVQSMLPGIEDVCGGRGLEGLLERLQKALVQEAGDRLGEPIMVASLSHSAAPQTCMHTWSRGGGMSEYNTSDEVFQDEESIRNSSFM